MRSVKEKVELLKGIRAINQRFYVAGVEFGNDEKLSSVLAWYLEQLFEVCDPALARGLVLSKADIGSLPDFIVDLATDEGHFDEIVPAEFRVGGSPCLANGPPDGERSLEH